jgi:UDP-N-acetylmuramyl pentapeptide synthase
MSKITTFIVTGTKGKTSVVTLINHFLGPNYHKLLVSSEGVFLNSRKIASYQDSLINFGRSPNVRPGR